MIVQHTRSRRVPGVLHLHYDIMPHDAPRRYEGDSWGHLAGPSWGHLAGNRVTHANESHTGHATQSHTGHANGSHTPTKEGRGGKKGRGNLTESHAGRGAAGGDAGKESG